MKQISNYKVSNTTANFVSALATLDKTENEFLNALRSLYGEDPGDSFFHKSDALFDGRRKQIAEFLAMSITLRMSSTEKDMENVI